MFEKEAEEYAKLNARQYIHNDGIGFCTSAEEVEQAYLAGAEPREKRIAELKADNDARKFAMAMSEKVEKQLQEENAELKTENKTAKEIIREYSKRECEYCDYKRNPNYVTEHCSQCQKYSLHKRAEAFIKE